MEKLPISVIVLTHNDDKIIEEALQSVHGWVEDIFVVDDGSQDRTLDIVRRYTDKIERHCFENYASQRNWALDNLPLKTSWILPLDADQRVTPELKTELFGLFADGKEGGVNGYIAPTKTVFLGRWIRHGGHYPIYRVYLLRKGKARWEERKYHQHCIVDGATGSLTADIVDIIAPDIKTFVERITTWAYAEADEIVSGAGDEKVKARIFGDALERKRWLRTKFYWKLPLFWRAFAYFFYRYILRGGFLDGIEGIIFHVTQGFYIHFLTDAAIYERRMAAKSEGARSS